MLGRYLSKDDIGIYGILTAAVAVVSVAIPFSPYVERTRPSTDGLTTRQAVAVQLHVITTAGFVALLSLPIAHHLMETVTAVKIPAAPYYLAIGIWGASSMLSFGRGWIQSEYRHVTATIAINLPDPLWIVFFAVGLTLAANPLGLALACRLIATAAAAAFALVAIPWRAVVSARFRKSDALAVLRFCAPLAAVAESFAIAGVADRVVLSRYVSLAALGQYTFMYMLFGMTVVAVAAVQRIANVRAMGQANRNDRKGSRRTMLLLAVGLATLSLASGIAIAATAPIVKAVTKKALLPSTATIMVTAIAFGLFYARTTWQLWFQVHFRTGILAAYELLNTAVYLAALFLLAPRYGLLGAALAFAVGGIFGLALYSTTGFRLQPSGLGTTAHSEDLEA
jgi:O-antigen/teichoic acid export membrane protein